jgi:hypothetical protein
VADDPCLVFLLMFSTIAYPLSMINGPYRFFFPASHRGRLASFQG